MRVCDRSSHVCASDLGCGQSFERISARKRLAGDIGPIVWELEGPIPILNTSKTDKNIQTYSSSEHMKRCQASRPPWRRADIGFNGSDAGPTKQNSVVSITKLFPENRLRYR